MKIIFTKSIFVLALSLLLFGVSENAKGQTELLLNNYFNDSLTSWELWGAANGSVIHDSTAKLEGDFSAHITCTLAGGEGWQLGFAQGIPGGVKANHTYYVSYMAVASSDVVIDLAIQQTNTPWGNIFSKTASLTTIPQTIIDTFKVKAGEPCNFVIQLGGIGLNEVWLDSISLVEIAPSSDATLSNLTFDGTTITGFKSDSVEYSVKLTAGTTDIPVTAAVVSHDSATMLITQATELPGGASVVVTAEDGTENTYTVYYSVAGVVGTDASLKDILVNDVSIPDFVSSTLSYDIELPFGTTSAIVLVSTTDSKATTDITQADAIPGTATIVVTAEDESTEETYTVNFTLEPAIAGKELLLNNYFNDSLTSWELWGAANGSVIHDSTAKLEGDFSAHITCTLAGGEGWQLGFAQGIPGGVKANHTYYVSYMAVASSDVDIDLAIQQADDPWGAIYSKTVSLTTISQTIIDTFKVKAGEPCNFVIQLGGIGLNEVWLDSIFVKEVAPSSDATLSDLTFDGTTITGFKSDSVEYSVELTAGTTDIPVTAAVISHDSATMLITQATELPGGASVVVTAEDGTEKTYTVYYSVAGVVGTDASLKDILVNDVSIPDFVSSTLSYDIELPFGTTSAIVLVSTTDSKATTDITQADAIPGTATIVVTAEDEATEETYTVNFTLEPAIAGKELLLNNYFDGYSHDNDSLYNWELWLDGAEGIVEHDSSSKLEGKYSAHITRTLGDASWQLGFAQGYWGGIKEGWTYIVKYQAVATGAVTLEQVLQATEDPWAALYSSTLDLSTEPKTYIDTFTVAVGEAGNCNFVFQLGNIGDVTVWLDDVHLVVIDSVDAEESNINLINANSGFELEQNYPNPFSATTTVNFTLTQPEKVKVSVYNSVGQNVLLVANREFFAGKNSIEIDLSNYPTGMYFYQVQTASFSKTKKMMLVK